MVDKSLSTLHKSSWVAMADKSLSTLHESSWVAMTPWKFKYFALQWPMKSLSMLRESS